MFGFSILSGGLGFDLSTPIGAAAEGGYYAGLIKTGEITYAIIVAPAAGGSSGPINGSNGTPVSAPSTNDGYANSQLMNSPAYPAAYFCRGLTIGGFTDWYLPSQDELELLYYSFKPSTAPNVGGPSGVNPSAVPARLAGYSPTNPALTSVAAFAGGGSETMSPLAYWSSTSSSSVSGLLGKSFDNGNLLSGLGYLSPGVYVRAVRRVEI